MYTDDDKTRRERLKKQAKERAEISALTDYLKFILEDPSPCMPRLDRHSEILDQLLYAVMRRNLRQDRENGQFDKDSINLALRIQKQSMDALKASHAIDYMRTIGGTQEESHTYVPLMNKPIPPPPENWERTDEV